MERTLTEVVTRRERVASSAGTEISVRCEALLFTTSSAPEFIDITDDVQRVVAEAGTRFG